MSRKEFKRFFNTPEEEEYIKDREISEEFGSRTSTSGTSSRERRMGRWRERKGEEQKLVEYRTNQIENERQMRIAKEYESRGQPAQFARHYLYSFLPEKNYDPSIKENRENYLLDYFRQAEPKFSPGNYKDFTERYVDAYTLKQIKIRDSPWISHIRRTARDMTPEQRKKLKRGDLFRIASRTFTFSKGRKLRKPTPHPPIGKYAVIYAGVPEPLPRVRPPTGEKRK